MRENTTTLTELQSVPGLDDLEGVEGISEFDSAEHLTTKTAIAAYLSFAAKSGDLEHFKAAVATAARAEKMAKIAEVAGISREGAYKSLKPGTKVQMATMMGILDALGMTLAVVPKDEQVASDDNDNSYALMA
jgi:probable addiction module antidote protein